MIMREAVGHDLFRTTAEISCFARSMHFCKPRVMLHSEEGFCCFGLKFMDGNGHGQSIVNGRSWR